MGVKALLLQEFIFISQEYNQDSSRKMYICMKVNMFTAGFE
jgi:hypothetical protein